MKYALLVCMLLTVAGCGRAKRQNSVLQVATTPVVQVAESLPEQTADEDSSFDIVPSDEIPATEQTDSTFWQQAQHFYEQAKESGSTTASSASAWVAELYDTAISGTQDATKSSADWIAGKYEEALQAGETSATSTKEWVMDDLGKIGTWKYKVLEIRSDDAELIEQELTELGARRWECFHVLSNADKTVFYLKRSHRSYLRYLPAKDLLRLVPLLQGEEG